jgi:hypothetical protein
MATRILDPERFILNGAVVDWTIAAKRHGGDAKAIADKRKITTSAVQLRWMLDPKLGLPSEAFQVWQRPHSATTQALKSVADVSQFPMPGRRWIRTTRSAREWVLCRAFVICLPP